MGQKITILIIIFILVIVQISVLVNFFPERAIPNLVLVLLIFWTARRGIEKTWKLAVLAGLIFDFLAFSPIGANAVSFLLTAFAAGYLGRRFLVTHQTWRFLILSLIMAAGTLVNAFSFWLILELFLAVARINAGAPAFWNGALALQAGYNILLFALLYWPLKKIEKLFNLYGARAELKTNVR